MSAYSEAVLSDNPLLYLKLDESSGASCANSGSLGGVATCNGTFTRNYSSAYANLGVAVNLNGFTGDYISYPDTASLDIVSDVTYECWVKHLGSNYGGLISKNRDSPSTSGYCFRIIANRSIWVEPTGTGTPLLQTAAGTFPADGAWHHLAFTRSGNAYTIYLDGVSVATSTDSTVIVANSSPLSIGQTVTEFGPSSPWRGAIDEVAVYNTALSSVRIAAHYSARNTGSAAPSGIAARLKFGTGLSVTDEGAGVARVDASVGGSSYLYGSGAPASTLGVLQDLYEDILTGDLYQKQAIAGQASYRSSVATFDLNLQTHSVPIPADAAVGDLLVMALSSYSPGSQIGWTTPSGWTSRGAQYIGGSYSTQVFTRTKDGSEGSTVTVIASNVSSSSLLSVTAYQNANGVDVVGTASGSGTSLTFPSVTTTVINDLLVGLALLPGDPGGVTPDAAWVERIENVVDPGLVGTLYVMDRIKATAGASGTAVISWPATLVTPYGYTIAIKGGGATVPTWVRLDKRLLRSLVDAKGDLLVGSADDSVARLPVGSNNQVLTADSAQSSGMKWAAVSSGALILLNTVNLASNGTFDISSIPQTYNDLVLILIAKGAGTGGSENPIVRFNNDTAANYRRSGFQVWNANPAYPHGEADNWIITGVIPDSAGSYPAGAFGMIEIVIPGYASTVWRKSLLFRSYAPYGASVPAYDYYADGGGAWASQAAINRIQIAGSLGNLVTGSQLRLYGRT